MLIRSMEKNVSNFVVDPKRDFVRKSELSFSKTMRFILGMGSQTLGKELMEFYDFDPKMVSVSAIVQRRSHAHFRVHNYRSMYSLISYILLFFTYSVSLMTLLLRMVYPCLSYL